MASLNENATLSEFQSFIKDVYGVQNDRNFDMWDMVSNVERFLMRGMKGIRKNDAEKTRANLMISFSWFMSFMNQLHVDIEEEVWKRFPYLCSYCASCPCVCKEKKVENRQEIKIDGSRRPRTLSDFQKMFDEIYPSSKRTLEHAGIHLAEEMGELSEAVFSYRGTRQKTDFDDMKLEAADFVSCFMGTFSSLKMDLAKELSSYFYENCHVCHKMPCECEFSFIVNFKS